VAGVIGDFDQRLPFLDGALDLVVMADTIEHTRTPREIVREVRRVLAPEGTFVVFTPPYDRVRWVLAEKGHHLLTRRPADHISPFTHEALHYLLAEFFARREVGTVNFGLTMFGVASGRRDG
jgi:SAM-dependent methyltransferase